MYVCSPHVCIAHRGQKRVSGSGDGCEPPCGSWESYPSPLEKQLMLLAAEPSLQPQKIDFTYIKKNQRLDGKLEKSSSIFQWS